MTVSRFAPAKINLCLHVGRPNPDGRHPLESLVVFARDVGDSLSAARAGALTLAITGPYSDALPVAADNLVLRAARALAGRAGVAPQAALVLDKQLPIASGIGGGSADAAAALRILNELWCVGASLGELEGIAAELGADVPACVQSRTVRMTGTGEAIEHVDCPQLHAVLVNPGVLAPTGAVYRAFDVVGLGSGARPVGAAPQTSAAALRWLAMLTNDLEPAAITVAPAIGDVLSALRGKAPEALVRMSGSGATCFAVVGDAEAAAGLAAEMRLAHPDWWIRPAVLG